MKRTTKFRNKIIMFILALIFPLSASGALFLTFSNHNNAEGISYSKYLQSYIKEITLSNSNFNSSSSAYSLSTSISGWTGQISDRKTTAGTISTGNSFQRYMTGTFHLANNPGTKANDNYILMINSKIENTNNNNFAKQGYKNNNAISLSANSYYSFQASFKADTNYDSTTIYNPKDKVRTDVSIDKDTFKSGAFGEYISFSYNSKYYYVLKELDTEDTTTLEQAHSDFNDIFYDDGTYIGIINPEVADSKTPVFVKIADLESFETGHSSIDLKAGTTLYKCKNITYSPTTSDVTKGNFVIASGTQYFEKDTSYTPYDVHSYGSVYLSGLTDEDGNPVKAEFVKVASKEWVTFYFFVATGSKTQSVNLELWLGSKESKSSGVVFFDDCHIYQYSENAFWKAYQNVFNRNYETATATKQYCSQFIDLRNDKETIDTSNLNFDFEEGIYNSSKAIKNWEVTASSNDAHAQIFNTNDPVGFKNTTGFDFVGNDLSCEAKYEIVEENGEERVIVSALKENKYLLALWADSSNVRVTSDNVEISSNEIYKITAKYKVSEVTSGNAYMFVKENDSVLKTYSLTEKDYTIKDEAASSGVNSNNDNEISNSWGTIEFFVKGGALYDSKINISLGLGKTDENATGCVLFDNITIEKATSSDYSSASNKLELGSSSGTPTITNGNFNSVDNTNNSLNTPTDWTITNGDELCFAGVINTDEEKYNEYRAKYNKNQENEATMNRNNDYYWASADNPGNSRNKKTPDNILMLANIDKTWQKVKSSNISLDANGTFKINFKYKTNNYSLDSGVKVSIYGDDNFKIFESPILTTNGSWKEYEIYLKSFNGASTIYLELDFGTEDEKVDGYAFFDNFEFGTVDEGVYETKDERKIVNEQNYGVVDMTNFFLNLPVNNITDDIRTSYSPAYSGALSSGNSKATNGGVVLSSKFSENNSLYIDNEEKTVFYIQSQSIGAYYVQSNYNIDLKQDTYYKLTFKLKTNFNYCNNENVKLDKTKKYSYGATVGLTGFNYMQQLVSNDNYETYTLYINPKADTSSKLYMALICDSQETAGEMVIYDFNFAESSKEEYDATIKKQESKKYDINSEKAYSTKTQDETDSDSSDSNTDSDTDTENTNNSSNDFNWLLIPTLITAVAIVIAIAGYFMRKIKIKKIQRKRSETYDRTRSTNIDEIKKMAVQEQEKQLAEIKEIKQKFEKELENLEQAHKQKVVALREKDKGKVSKETDKEFKTFAQKRTVIAEKIDSLNKQIEEINSPEYMLNLERKAYLKEEAKRKELKKLSDKMNSKKKSSEAETKKLDKTNKPNKTKKS